MKFKSIAIALLALLPAFSQEALKTESPKVDPDKKAEFFKAIAKLNKAVAETKQAALDKALAQAALEKATAEEGKHSDEAKKLAVDVNRASDKLCPAGFTATPGDNDEPRCGKPKSAEVKK